MADRPNLLFILADQLRHDFLGCYGADFVRTPNVDRLAAGGVRFGQALSAHPVCVPARASLLVGMHAGRTGVLDNQHWLPPDLSARGVRSWPELLAGQGYQTAAIGKMHFYPWDARHGFQHRRIAEDKRWIHVRDDYDAFLRARGQRKLHGNEHDRYHECKGAIVNRLPWELQVDHWVGEETLRFLQGRAGEGPWAAMVGFPGPHCPYDPAPEFLERIDRAKLPEPIPSNGQTPTLVERTIAGNRAPWNGVDYAEFTREQKLRVRAHYAALVEQIDHEVGRILDALPENTVVLFTSDHGDLLGDHDLIGKANFYEGSCHVPLIVSQPGGPVGACDDLVTLTDVTATLLRLGGADVPSYMDARPLPGLGIEGAAARDHVIGALAGGWMIQRGALRLSRYATGESTLFDLAADPTEQQSRLDHPAARQLDAELGVAMMGALVASHAAQRLPPEAYWENRAFGREGWQRPYPLPIA